MTDGGELHGLVCHPPNSPKSESTSQDQWLVFPNLADYAKEFDDIGPNSARKISGSQAKAVLEQSKLPSKALPSPVGTWLISKSYACQDMPSDIQAPQNELMSKHGR